MAGVRDSAKPRPTSVRRMPPICALERALHQGDERAERDEREQEPADDGRGRHVVPPGLVGLTAERREREERVDRGGRRQREAGDHHGSRRSRAASLGEYDDV